MLSVGCVFVGYLSLSQDRYRHNNLCYNDSRSCSTSTKYDPMYLVLGGYKSTVVGELSFQRIAFRDSLTLSSLSCWKTECSARKNTQNNHLAIHMSWIELWDGQHWLHGSRMQPADTKREQQGEGCRAWRESHRENSVPKTLQNMPGNGFVIVLLCLLSERGCFQICTQLTSAPCPTLSVAKQTEEVGQFQ